MTCVIHAAAVVSFNPRRATEVMDINFMGTRNVVNACLTGSVKRLVHISSVAALGRQKGQHKIDENNPWVDSKLNSVYAESKYFAELEVFRGQEEGLSCVMVNPSVILAPADWTRSSAKLFKYVWDQLPFYTDAYLNYVDVRDVSNIVYQLIKSPHEAQRFIVNAGHISFGDFFQQIARKFNRKAPSLRLNRTLLQFIARTESVRSRIIGGEPLITRETARLAGTEFLYINKKITQALNFQFQPIEETLQWCCEYYMIKMSTKN